MLTISHVIGSILINEITTEAIDNIIAIISKMYIVFLSINEK